MRQVGYWLSFLSFAFVVAGLVAGKCHSPTEERDIWWRVAVALGSCKFGFSFLGFFLNLGDLVSKRSWPEVRDALGGAFNSFLLFILNSLF